jgi:hypothetical protein
MFPEVEGDLNRLVEQQVISCGFVPDYGLFMLCLSGDVTLYLRCDSQMLVQVEAPCLQ